MPEFEIYLYLLGFPILSDDLSGEGLWSFWFNRPRDLDFVVVGLGL